MHISITLRILGILLMLFSLTLIAPLVLALVFGDATVPGFATALGITLLSGICTGDAALRE